jgi:hypothetical protein
MNFYNSSCRQGPEFPKQLNLFKFKQKLRFLPKALCKTHGTQ